MGSAPQAFDPSRYEHELVPLIGELSRVDRLEPLVFDAILRRYPKDGKGFFKKSEIIAGFRHYRSTHDFAMDEGRFVERLRAKPIRTASGIAPVTVLTKPFPCPGRCIFCPNDLRMPKSYIASEPGAQRAETHRFDPYLQTFKRIEAFARMGHATDKVELLVLGGTWSYYPEAYQVWFIERCLEAMSDFGSGDDRCESVECECPDFKPLEREAGASYNQQIVSHLESHHRGELLAATEQASWAALEAAQRRNERAGTRCVGLVLETRPDLVSKREVERLRRLGATKVQIGYQSLSDSVLEANKRGHSVDASRRATRLLRRAGFKVLAHWMPNLYGAKPESDIEDYDRIFEDPDLRPDELKIYPCSLIEDTELMDRYRSGDWRPYSDEELSTVLTECLRATPEYCRLARVIRDIPSPEIVAGNLKTNFREIAERELAERKLSSRDIRSREIRLEPFDAEALELRALEYAAGDGSDVFLQFVTSDDRIVAFLRLSLPKSGAWIPELCDAALVRELHVYGPALPLEEASEKRPQHSGLGRLLLEEAARRAHSAGFEKLSVISAIGTRDYYRKRGFVDGELYQHRRLSA